ncbi:Uncharacterised protein [Streptococcus pneumoniae]|nr:Uncharacterised protein [Streptococcus pneumoniae]
MDKFTTKEITVEILEYIEAHKVYRAKINGVESIVGYHKMEFLRSYIKKEVTQ